MNTQKSLYEYILQSMKDGCLEDGFSLPKPEDETGISFADGALDGITVYHMQSTHLNEEGTGLMLKALAFAAEGNAGEADPAFAALGRSFRAVSIIDELQSYIIEHQEKLPASNVYRTALHLILHSADRESVKFGLSILELFKVGDESVKEAVRTLGSSDEFTIFSVWNMLRWENANREIFELIKKVRGWGRIHALERLEPETPEISDWILYCGVDNDVMPAYSALTAWEKAGVQERLQDRITQKEFEAVGRIISALLDEGPVQGISAIENAGDIIMKYLAFADSFSLGDEDRQTIEELMKWAQREETALPEIAQKCSLILK